MVANKTAKILKEGENKMAGLPNYSDNPITSGNAGQNGDKSMEVALASKMQLILDQPMADVDSGLTNRDFEGDFFRIGDTVALIKPDIDSLAIEFGQIATKNTSNPQGKPIVGGASGDAAAHYSNKDARLIPTNVEFDKTTLTIDKYAKYAFYISDFTEAEGKWNYESGNLDAVAQEMRKRHNLETVQLIVDNAVGSGAAFGNIDTVEDCTVDEPIEVANGDDVYEKVIVPMFAQLYDAGAITADGQITYGSNAQEGKSTYGCIYVPTKLYTMLLTSKYLQDRSTVAADEKVKTGKVKTIMGLDISIEPSLNPTAARHITLLDETSQEVSDVLAVIAGTRNLVTKAGKVLPPERLRSPKFFADEFHGCELYTKEVVEPKAGSVAFVKISTGE